MMEFKIELNGHRRCPLSKYKISRANLFELIWKTHIQKGVKQKSERSLIIKSPE